MKYLIFTIAILHITICFCDVQTSDNELIRVLSTGSLLKGAKITVNDNKTIHLYLGIPYAESPSEQNRYKAPIPRATWDGILDASYYKVSCLYDSPDFDVMLRTRFMSEDCLHVNVISSEWCIQNGGCPIVVYLHGSNFDYASSSMIPIEGIAHNWATKDIIVVTMNFRLGSFGFLNFGEKTTAASNAGLLDQLEAIRWVQREISRFGGDTGRVTLMGFGSGAINVDLLTISSAATGLFQQVVVVGGAAGTMPNINEDSNVAASRELAIEVGCATRLTWDTTRKEDIVNCLRGRKASELLSVQRLVEDKNKLYAFNLPAIDARETAPIIPNSVSALNKMRPPYTMMIGGVSNPMSWLKNAIKPTLLIPKKKMMKAICGIATLHRHFNFTLKLVKACQREYSTVLLGSDLMEDVAVFLPIYDSASANAKNGGTTFLFEYLSDSKEKSLSPFAASDSGNSTESDYIKTAISRFIKTGNPSSESLIWQPFEVGRDNFIALTSGSTQMNVNGYHLEAVNFWTKTIPQIAENTEWLKENGRNIMNELIEAGKEAISSFAETIGSIKEEKKKAITEAIWKIASSLRNLEEEIVREKEAAADKMIEWLQGHTSDSKDASLLMPNTKALAYTFSARVADILLEVNSLLDGVSDDAYDISADSAVGATVECSEDRMNNVGPAIRAAVVRNVARSATLKEDAETSTNGAYWETWMNGTWFWIIHIAIVVILVSLVLTFCILCCSQNRGRNYEILA